MAGTFKEGALPESEGDRGGQRKVVALPLNGTGHGWRKTVICITHKMKFRDRSKVPVVRNMLEIFPQYYLM